MKTATITGLLLAGIAIVGGVYAIGAASGNKEQAVAALSDAATVKAASCEHSVEKGKKLGSAAQGDLAAFRPLDDPLDLKTITFKDKDGNPASLADWAGKTVLFNLWATWCPPCREEMPWFEELQIKKGGDDFQVVPVSIDLGDPSKPKHFYDETGLKELPFYHDNTMEAFQSLKRKAVALGMPTTLLVDTNGCGLGVLNGPAHWNSPDALRLIDAATALNAEG